MLICYQISAETPTKKKQSGATLLIKILDGITVTKKFKKEILKVYGEFEELIIEVNKLKHKLGKLANNGWLKLLMHTLCTQIILLTLKSMD